jgi:hypothetical protein
LTAEDEAVDEVEQKPAASNGRGKRIFVLFLEALLLSNIVVLFDIIFISFLTTNVAAAIYMLSLVTLLEGGIGLVFGGLMVVGAGPTFSKIGEKAFHGTPYSARRARDSEANARVFFFFSAILIAVGFFIPYIFVYSGFG